MPGLIGLCGHMGAGKDAAAALLAMVGYSRMAFADRVRVEVVNAIEGGMVPRAALGVAYVADWLMSATVEEVWAKPTSDRMRKLLQWWGTDFRRSQDPDYWVKEALNVMALSTRYVVSDVRFPNEVEFIRKHGGVIWRIDRETTPNGIPGHASESAVDTIQPDQVVDNRGTLLDLAGLLNALLREEQYA
jgi:hypothetical protein